MPKLPYLGSKLQEVRPQNKDSKKNSTKPIWTLPKFGSSLLWISGESTLQLSWVQVGCSTHRLSNLDFV
jgi:hypothetical protein